MNDNTLQKIKAMNDGKIAGILNQKRSNPYEKNLIYTGNGRLGALSAMMPRSSKSILAESPTETMDKQSPSPESDFLMTPPRLSGHQLLKIWLELRKEFRSSPEFSKADSPEWRLYHAITQRFTDDASLLKECFVTLDNPITN